MTATIQTEPTTTTRQVKILATNGIDENRAFVIDKGPRYSSYYQEHRLALMEYSRLYYQKNRDAILQKKKDYSERNRDKISEARRRYYQSHKDAISRQQRQYRDNKNKKAEINPK